MNIECTLPMNLLTYVSACLPTGRPALEVMREICPDKKLASYFSGLWIDTGARPDTGTFFLMAAVIRGIPREGGSYPRGGSQKMAMALVETLERNGGRALVKAEVGEITIDATTGAASGAPLPLPLRWCWCWCLRWCLRGCLL